MAGRSNKEEFERRLAATDEAMVRLPSTYAVCKAMHEKFGVGMRTVRNWIRIVREQRRAEEAPIDLEVRRDQARARFEFQYAQAVNKTEVVRDKNGDPVLDAAGKPLTHPRPDIRAALHANREIVHLDGLAKPVTQEIKIEGDVAKMPDLKDPKVLVALENYLKATSPTGDPTEAAGPEFRFSGDRP